LSITPWRNLDIESIRSSKHMDIWNQGEANFGNVTTTLAERNMRRKKRSRFKLGGVRILELY
jgi:hypothetical protein